MKSAEAITYLRSFIGPEQLQVLISNCRGEERQYFCQTLLDLAERIKGMPKTYDTDGQGAKAVVYLHYFKGSADWFITEKDMDQHGQHQAFGLADLCHDGSGGEMGYISIEELKQANVEIDLHWTPKTLEAVRKNRS